MFLLSEFDCNNNNDNKSRISGKGVGLGLFPLDSSKNFWADFGCFFSHPCHTIFMPWHTQEQFNGNRMEKKVPDCISSRKFFPTPNKVHLPENNWAEVTPLGGGLIPKAFIILTRHCTFSLAREATSPIVASRAESLANRIRAHISSEQMC